MSFGLEEFRNPERTIPLVFWVSFIVVSAMYLLFAWIVSASAVGDTDVSGLSGVSALLGTGALRSVLLAVFVFVLFTNANAWVFGASRAFFAAARQGLLPAPLARVDGRGIPATSLVSCLVVYCLIIAVIDLTAIETKYAFLMTAQGFIILYGGSILAYMRMNPTVGGYLCGGAALAGWAFLMSGFSWMIVYPVALFGIGVWLSRRSATAVS